MSLKNYFLALGASGILASGCAVNQKSSTRACCAEKNPAMAIVAANCGPLLETPDVWQDDTGNSVTLAALRGRPVLISMYYASCDGVCVITRNDMKAVEASLPAEVRDQITFVLVTLAPERDGLAELKQFRSEHGLAENRWRLWRGSPAATAALAARLGIGYGRDQSGLFRHASQLTVLDAAGNILLQQDGIHADLTATVKVLAAAIKPGTLVRLAEVN